MDAPRLIQLITGLLSLLPDLIQLVTGQFLQAIMFQLQFLCMLLFLCQLLFQRVFLRNKVSPAVSRCLFLRLLAGQHFTDPGYSGITLLRTFTKLGDHLSEGSKLLFRSSPFLGFLVQLQAHILHAGFLFLRLGLKLISTLTEDVGIVPRYGGDTGLPRTFPLLGKGAERSKPLLYLRHIMPCLVNGIYRRAGPARQLL